MLNPNDEQLEKGLSAEEVERYHRALSDLFHAVTAIEELGYTVLVRLIQKGSTE